MTVQEGPGSSGTKIIATRYPVTSGLIAGTTKIEGRQNNLVPVRSFLPRKNQVGL